MLLFIKWPFLKEFPLFMGWPFLKKFPLFMGWPFLKKNPLIFWMALFEKNIDYTGQVTDELTKNKQIKQTNKIHENTKLCYKIIREFVHFS